MAVLNNGVIQQIGEPLELYDKPANLFVAEFLGTANVLQGRFETHDQGQRFVSVGGTEIPWPGSRQQGAGTIVIRPQTLMIVGEGTTGDDRHIALTGTVHYKEFLGSVIRYAVDVGSDTLLVDRHHRQGEPALEVGGRADLLLDPDQMVVLPAVNSAGGLGS